MRQEFVKLKTYIKHIHCIGRLESQGAAGINRRLVQRCVSVSARGSQGHPASGQSWENTIIIIIIIGIIIITLHHHHHQHLAKTAGQA